MTAGVTTSGINIAVPPKNPPTLVVEAVGLCTPVSPTTSNCQTEASGAQVARGQAATLFIVGTGIVFGTTTYSITGSQSGITVTQPPASNFPSCTSGTTSVPCVAVDISVSASAPLGPRNIEVTNSAGELSVFVGGLNITAP